MYITKVEKVNGKDVKYLYVVCDNGEEVRIGYVDRYGNLYPYSRKK